MELDQIYHFILETMVETGVAPHYSEIAKHFNVSPEEGRKGVHDLFQTGIPGWLYPNTDFIASFAPFNNQPTQFKISIDNEQKWFGQ